MKLFAVACLTGASAQYSGDGDRGAVVDSDYYNSYEYDDFGNKKNKNKNNFFGQKYAASAETTTGTDWAIALNCWPANIEADLLADPNHRNDGTTGDEDSGGARSPDTFPGQKYNAYGPQHVIGSFEVSARATALQNDVGLHTEDPVQRSGLGGLYQFGHDTYNSEFHNPNLDANSPNRGTRWMNYKQARHAGCLYEKSNWVYGHDTFDQVFLASYYQGYGSYDRTSGSAAYTKAYEEVPSTPPIVPPNVRGAGEVEPVWWHFFNAHILPNNQGGAATVPVNNVEPSNAAFLVAETQKSIPLVMANPAYEGLGYLNFVVEYKNKNKPVGENYLEFIDSSPGTFTNVETYQSAETYRKINDCAASAAQECSGWGNNLNGWDGVHGAYYYDLWMGSWLINKARDNNDATDRKWTIFPLTSGGTTVPADWGAADGLTVAGWSMDVHDSAGTTTAWSKDYDLVVSSFPHNNLGKDFRFNLRLLMGIKTNKDLDPATGGFRGDANANKFFSYYFYKINKIQIDFPFNVAYALYHEGRGDQTTTTGARIVDTIQTEGEWWKTLNQDADNHPGQNSGAAYEKKLNGNSPTNPNTFSSAGGVGDDYQFMHRSASDDNENIIPPVDLGTHAGPNGEFHRIRGYIKSQAAALDNAADWCTNAALGRDIVLETLCGKQFFIEGLMNTYDERRGQRGTYQEIWVQLQYALGNEGRDGRTNCANGDARCLTVNDPFQSPWPYNHFMASEIVKIIATCDNTDVNNANSCGPAGATGAGRPNDSYYGGK